MDKNNHSPFTPERIDTQIAQIANGAPDSLETALVDDLRQMYQDDERYLEHVWQRLGLDDDLLTHIEPSSTLLHLVPSEAQLPAHAGVSERGRSRQTRRHSISHALSLIAAVLVAALIVGSVLIVLPQARPQSAMTLLSLHASPTGIYLSNGDTVLKLDTQTRQVIWQQALKNVVKILPAGNMVYLLQGNIVTAGLSSALALDGKSGKTLWKHDFPLQTSDLVLSQNLLYVSVEDTNKAIGAKNAGQIYVLNAQDGSQHALYSPIDSAWSLVVGDGVLGVSTDTGLRAYDAMSGKMLWQVPLSSSARPKVDAMSIVDGLLYASVIGGSIMAYKSHTGEQVWQSPNVDNITSFTVDHNTIYFGTSFYSLQEGVPVKGTVYAYDVQHKKQLWSQSVDGGVQQALLVSDGVVYVAAANGSHSQAHIAALIAATGAIKWQKPLDNDNTEAFSLIDSVLYVANPSDWNQPPAPNAIVALSPEDGSKLWVDSRFGSAQALVATE